MKFKELVKGYTKEGKGPEYYPSITVGWNAAIEECAEIARNHPVFFKNGNIKSADMVRGEIADAIEKSRKA